MSTVQIVSKLSTILSSHINRECTFTWAYALGKEWLDFYITNLIRHCAFKSSHVAIKPDKQCKPFRSDKVALCKLNRYLEVIPVGSSPKIR